MSLLSKMREEEYGRRVRIADKASADFMYTLRGMTPRMTPDDARDAQMYFELWRTKGEFYEAARDLHARYFK